MIFICSRGREAPLSKFFNISLPSLPGRVLIDDDDETYKDFDLPEGWEFVVGKRAPVAQLLNRAYNLYPEEQFYAVVCDDMVYTTANWDQRLSDACGTRYVSWGDDGRWGKQLCTSFFVGGDLVRKMGWLAHPGTGHLYTDTIWWMIASGAKLGKYVPEVKFKHTKIMDKTFRERSISGDAEAFERLRTCEIPQLTLKALSK